MLLAAENTDMRKRILIFALAGVLLLPGCSGGAQETSEQRSIFAMDTYMTLTAYGEHASEALDAAEEEILFLDDLLSTGNPESEISSLNSSGNAVVSDVSALLLKTSLQVSEMTEGAFNPLIYPLMKEWGFTDDKFHVPDEETIEQILPLLNLSDLSFDEETQEISFETEGMMIDFGGIAKGYTSSRVMEILSEHGVTSAIISLGGNVQALGTKPGGEDWKVAIRDPEDSSSYLGVLQTADKAVITSGGYERYFEENGVTYHHILDPETGYPADSGLLSVTIVSSDGTLADGLSTALFVLGVEKGIDVWKENADLFDVIFMTADHELYVSEGIIDNLSNAAYPVHVISKTG